MSLIEWHEIVEIVKYWVEFGWRLELACIFYNEHRTVTTHSHDRTPLNSVRAGGGARQEESQVCGSDGCWRNGWRHRWSGPQGLRWSLGLGWRGLQSRTETPDDPPPVHPWRWVQVAPIFWILTYTNPFPIVKMFWGTCTDSQHKTAPSPFI